MFDSLSTIGFTNVLLFMIVLILLQISKLLEKIWDYLYGREWTDLDSVNDDLLDDK